MPPVDLRNFTFDELTRYVTETLGHRKFRAQQLFEWIHRHNVNDFDQMTNLAKAFRDDLARSCTLKPIEVAQSIQSEDGTEKLQFKLSDGSMVESVLIPSDERMTLCVSSQVGCAMGCRFCLTGTLKLQRNLTCSEIVDQYRQARAHLGNDPECISNIVLMGMGEPLHNLDNVVNACNILMHDHGVNFSGRKLTVSTSGLVPEIKALGERCGAGLAVSLNATTDEVRSRIMPVNKRYPLAQLIAALEAFPKPRKKRIVLEYVLLDGINNLPEDAKRLIKIARRVGGKVNLIPFNPHEQAEFQPPPTEEVFAFQRKLTESGVNTFIRQSKGQDIYGACGMLGKGADKKQ